MSTNAVGVYLQTLRDQLHLTRAKMAEEIGTTQNSIWRIESGRQEPGAWLLARIVQRVHGSLEDVLRLAVDATATIEDGRRAAEVAARPRFALTERQRTAIAALTSEELDLLVDLAERLQCARGARQ